MSKLEKLIKLSQERDHLKSTIDRMEKVQGRAGDGSPICHTLTFESNYHANAYWSSYQDDGELNAMLLQVAIKHLKERLITVNDIIMNAEELLADA